MGSRDMQGDEHWTKEHGQIFSGSSLVDMERSTVPHRRRYSVYSLRGMYSMCYTLGFRHIRLIGQTGESLWQRTRMACPSNSPILTVTILHAVMQVNCFLTHSESWSSYCINDFILKRTTFSTKTHPHIHFITPIPSLSDSFSTQFKFSLRTLNWEQRQNLSCTDALTLKKGFAVEKPNSNKFNSDLNVFTIPTV